MLEVNTEIKDTNTIDLTQAPESEISELISRYGLHAGIPFIREVGLCLKAEKIEPDEDALRFFDAILLASMTKCENINISELFANDEETVKTFSDIFSKHEYLSGKSDGYISLADMTEVASKYFATLNVYAPSSVTIGDGEFKIEDSNKNELLSFALKNEPSLPYGYVSEEEACEAETEKI